MSALLGKLREPVALVFAPTGMVPTRAMTPHVPLTPSEVARDVRLAADIGITSVHLHARDDDGKPTFSRDRYAELVGAVRAAVPEIVINVSTSGRLWPDLERRSSVLELTGDLKPDIASLTTSSLNFIDGASVNEPAVVRGLAKLMRERGIVPELEIFDLGMINFALILRKEGLLPGPFLANLFFGNVAGMQAGLGEMGLAVDRLPTDAYWCGAGLGSFQFTAQALAIAAGGGVRVGLEDGIFFDRDRTELATNAQLVERVHEMVALAGRTVMTPAEYRRDVLSRVAP
jgi:3-keto-5-aminohexanoate cleavage enzyme